MCVCCEWVSESCRYLPCGFGHCAESWIYPLLRLLSSVFSSLLSQVPDVGVESITDSCCGSDSVYLSSELSQTSCVHFSAFSPHVRLAVTQHRFRDVPWRSVTFRDSGAVSQIRLLTPSFCPYTRFRFHKLYRNPDSLTSVSSPCLSASRIPISVPGSVKVLSSVRVHGFSVQRWNPVLFLDFSPKTQTGLRSMGDPSVFAYSPGLWSWRAAETRHAHTLAFTFLNL